ncbi:MAG: Oligopeptide-binding protein AppA [Chlamydiae bacterium]|nr:Oligopeptide-binding protein AppA [Chlamydiota bacterium]
MGGSLVLLGMLYWSSSLIEGDLKAMRKELKRLQEETSNLNQKIRFERLHRGGIQEPNPLHDLSARRSQVDSKYPNLLEEDTFYSQTLPALLGDDFHPQGILKEAMMGRPDNLHPFNNFRDVSNMIDMCTVRVASLAFGKYETMAPDMAIKLEARPQTDKPHLNEYWIHLRSNVFWAPLDRDHFPRSLELAPQFFQKHPVTAHDFKFFYDTVMNPYISEAKAASLRTYFSDIESFQVIDDHTFVIRWKANETIDEAGNPEEKIKYTSLSLTGGLQPLPRFVYQYFADGEKIIEEEGDGNAYRHNSIFAQNFSQHWAKNVIVSCGSYLFDGMNEEGILFRRNPDFYNPYATLVKGAHYLFKESPDAAWQDFKVGKTSFCTLSPNQLLELAQFLESPEYQIQQSKGQGIEELDFVDMGYYYIGWNETKPFFGSPKIRQAMSMAIDQNRIIEQNLNEMGVDTSGPFFRYSSSYNDEIPSWPFDPDEARKILDKEGWIDLDGDGIRDKVINGEKIPFRFSLTYFVKSRSSKVIAEYIATCMREIGVECLPKGLDIADISRQFDDKNFDALFMGWKLGTPPEDPRQLWHSSGAREKGSSNAIGFCNPKIDLLIEELNYEYDKERRTELYHKFHKIIHEQCPYTFLYVPKIRLLYRQSVQNLFIPRERQDLIPEADIPEPSKQVVWLKEYD